MVALPEIGSKGTYTFYEPFVVYNNIGQFTCQGIMRINEYIASGKNAKKLIYQKNNILDKYNDDVNKNVIIVALESATGMWLYVPLDYITTLPNVDGIPYTGMVLSIDIGTMPIGQDYSNAIVGIQQVIKESLGVSCNIIPVETTSITLLSKPEHDLIKNTKKGIMKSQDSLLVRYVILAKRFDIALLKIKDLEAYILKWLYKQSKLTYGCDSDIDIARESLAESLFMPATNMECTHKIKASDYFLTQSNQ